LERVFRRDVVDLARLREREAAAFLLGFLRALPRREPFGRRDFAEDFAGRFLRGRLLAAITFLRAFCARGANGSPLAEALPAIAPIAPPTAAPTGPATLPINAPAAAPAAGFEIGGI
jgi:hypothetical protein